MTKTTRKVSLTLPTSLISELDSISAKLEVSRSALVSGLLERITPKLASVSSDKAYVPSGSSSRRYTGGFVVELHDMLQDLSLDSPVLGSSNPAYTKRFVTELRFLLDEFNTKVTEMEHEISEK